MKNYRFILVNVFAQEHFGGNPLAVFPDAEGLDEQTMQNIARQFNLSETVFVFGHALRIFTPHEELPLAGHPVIGTAYVLRQERNLPENFILNTQAKPVSVYCNGHYAEMQIEGFQCQPAAATPQQFAQTLGIQEADLANYAYRVNSGSEQVLMQVKQRDSLNKAHLDIEGLKYLCRDSSNNTLYLWCEANGKIYSRLFWQNGNSVLEDSGTGSAAANLGAYYAFSQQAPISRTIFQGDHLNRPNRLSLWVDELNRITVGGEVIEVGSGGFYLPVQTEAV